jgi:hypothetical protein
MAPAKIKFNLPNKFTLLVETILHSKIEYEFLVDHLLVYIDK